MSPKQHQGPSAKRVAFLPSPQRILVDMTFQPNAFLYSCNYCPLPILSNNSTKVILLIVQMRGLGKKALEGQVEEKCRKDKAEIELAAGVKLHCR